MVLPCNAINGLVEEGAVVARYRSAGGVAITELALGEMRLFLSPRSLGSDELLGVALWLCGADRTCPWSIVRSRHGQPYARDGTGRQWSASVSVAEQIRAAIVVPSGAVGVDLETSDRIAANTDPADAWLHSDERRLLASLAPAEQVLELGCRWVLREAVGKALGLGLAAWLEPPVIRRQGARIILGDGAGAVDWRFGLYRHHDLLIAVARHPGRVSRTGHLRPPEGNRRPSPTRGTSP